MYPAEQEAVRNRYPDAGKLSPATSDKPRIQQQIDQLAKVLSGCHEGASDISGACDRLIGVTPSDPAKDGPRPPTSTVEQRLAEVIGYAEHLSAKLRESAQRLSASV